MCTLQSSISTKLFNHFHEKNTQTLHPFTCALSFSLQWVRETFILHKQFQELCIHITPNTTYIPFRNEKKAWIWVLFQSIRSELKKKHEYGKSIKITSETLNCQTKNWTCCCYCFIMEVKQNRMVTHEKKTKQKWYSWKDSAVIFGLDDVRWMPTCMKICFFIRNVWFHFCSYHRPLSLAQSNVAPFELRTFLFETISSNKVDSIISLRLLSALSLCVHQTDARLFWHIDTDLKKSLYTQTQRRNFWKGRRYSHRVRFALLKTQLNCQSCVVNGTEKWNERTSLYFLFIFIVVPHGFCRKRNAHHETDQSRGKKCLGVEVDNRNAQQDRRFFSHDFFVFLPRII